MNLFSVYFNLFVLFTDLNDRKTGTYDAKYVDCDDRYSDISSNKILVFKRITDCQIPAGDIWSKFPLFAEVSATSFIIYCVL